jgi:hypothetical protein
MSEPSKIVIFYEDTNLAADKMTHSSHVKITQLSLFHLKFSFFSDIFCMKSYFELPVVTAQIEHLLPT